MVDTMTCWFSVSDALTRVAVMVCVVCVTGGQLGAVQGTLRIPECSAQGWLDVREDATPAINCEGSGANQTVMWKIVRNNNVTVSSTCEPYQSVKACSRTSSDFGVYRFAENQSTLYIYDNHRDLASNGRVDCYVPDTTSSATCRINVIAPAVVPVCDVMPGDGTLSGTCYFNSAYSSNGTYTCTGTLTSTDRQNDSDVIFTGDITKTEQTLFNYGKPYYIGTCSFSRQISAGQYNYTVRFCPGTSGHEFQGSVNVTETIPHIPDCSAQGWLDVQEGALSYIQCAGFEDDQTVTWRIVRNNTVTGSSTCKPTRAGYRIYYNLGCNSTTSDLSGHRFFHYIILTIRDNHRELASNGRIDCYDTALSATCRLNVISPAELSDCELMMITDRTLAGICNFNNAYSSNGTYTCTWILTSTDRQNDSDVIFPGDIIKTEQTSDGKLYYRGSCSFSRQIPAGQYNYTVRFLPGKSSLEYQGSVTVPEPSSIKQPVQTTGSSGTLHIPQCSAQGWLQLLEDATLHLRCEGFGAEEIVMWRVVQNNTVTVNSTCMPSLDLPFETCNETSSDLQVYRLANTSSALYIEDNLRELASNGSVDCYVPDSTAAATCRINVISPAELSDCEVTMTTHRTLAGTCNFNNAYSSNDTYTCTWTLTPTDSQDSPEVIIPGYVIKFEQTSDGQLYYRGACFFARQIPGGTYTYTVRFFPGGRDPQFEGSVNVPAPAVLSDCEVTMATHQILAGTCNFNNAYSCNDNYTCTWTLTPSDRQGGPEVTFEGVINKTQHTVSGKVHYKGTCSFTSSWLPPGNYFYTVRLFPDGSQLHGTEAVTVTAADQSSSTAANFAGGVVAAVVVIVAVVVVVVLVRKYMGRRLYDHPQRPKRRQPGEIPYTSLNVYETVRQDM